MAIRIKELPAIAAAVDNESWEWLYDNLPELAEGVKTEVGRGATPEQVRVFVLHRTERRELALRCEQAARHLVAAAG